MGTAPYFPAALPAAQRPPARPPYDFKGRRRGPRVRILLLHCDHAEYRPIKKEIRLAEDVEPKPDSIDDGAVAFVTVEAGDDDDGAAAVDAAAAEIAKSLGRIGCRRLLLYPYAHLGTNLAPPAAALAALRDLEERVRAALSAPDREEGAGGPPDVRRAPFGWTKSYSISVKAHPLAEHSISVGGGGGGDAAAPGAAGGRPGGGGEAAGAAGGAAAAADSVALRSEARLESAWRIMTPDGKMHDAEGFDFSGHANLEVLAKYEAAKKRMSDEPPPHVGLMKRLAIADYEPASDPGNMRFYPNGRLVKSLIERYVTKRVRRYGGYEVETPVMYDARHPGMASYFDRFPARQYNIGSEDDGGGRRLFLRFAACFGQFMMAHDFQMSYRNLPYRLYELTRYSFRREQSGELVGLRRLRAFTMPDCHAFCRDMPQAIREMSKRFDLSREVVSGLGIRDGAYEMAVRMTEDFYAEHGEAVRAMVAKHGRPVLVEMWRERFFYFVLKWEFNYIDAGGKASALSTDQIDVENGERYGIEFVDENNERRHPIILHNSPSGAVERVMYALLEEAAAAARRGSKPELPLWLSPTQVRVIPVSAEFEQNAVALAGRIGHRQVRVDVDDRAETLGRRIRDAEREWIRFILVVGEREAAMDGGMVRVRDRRTGSTDDMPLDDLIGMIEGEADGKPFAGLNVPFYLSRRPQIMV